MSEARERRINHFKSKIFEEGPAPASRRMRSANSKSYKTSEIFTPAQPCEKKMSYSREKYFQNSGIFKADKEPVKVEVEERVDCVSMPPAGHKEVYVRPDGILGNDRPCFYKKNRNKQLDVPLFQPKFPEMSIKERIEKQLYGGFSVLASKKLEKQEVVKETPKQMKMKNLRSVFDKEVGNENIPPVGKKVQTEYSSSKRQFEVLASGVFSEKAEGQILKPSNKEIYDEKRHRNHLYTDLSGAEYQFSAKKKDLFSASESWLLHPSKPNNTSYDPKSHIFDSFRSSMTPPPQKPIRNRSLDQVPASCLSSTSSLLSPKRLKQESLKASLQPLQEFENTQPELFELQLTNLPKGFDKCNLRKLCEGVHLINYNLDFDAITGECKGAVQVSLRCNNTKALRNFELKLLGEGIKARHLQKSKVVRSKYWELSNAPMAEIREGRRGLTDPRTAKVNEQQSRVFGKPRKFTPVRQERDQAFTSQLQWKKTISARRENFNY